jgi:hypothetical protein
MRDLERGMLVRHASLGVGKVVALEPGAVHVFFAAGDKREATKLRLPLAGSRLTAVDADGNAWLAGLSGFVHDSKSGRYGLSGSWLSREEALARFLEAFPKGFADPCCTDGAPRRERASRWRRAHAAFVEAFGRGEGERLLAVGDVGELVTRALRVERHVRATLKDSEKETLQRSLQGAVPVRLFFAALFDTLAAPAPERSRFEALALAVTMLPGGGAREAGWPLATLFPFIAQPERHMLLRPSFTCEAAQRLGLDLRYQSEPNWATYAALLGSSNQLLEELKPLGARDLIDVESFLHVATAKPGARRSSTPRLVT